MVRAVVPAVADVARGVVGPVAELGGVVSAVADIAGGVVRTMAQLGGVVGPVPELGGVVGAVARLDVASGGRSAMVPPALMTHVTSPVVAATDLGARVIGAVLRDGDDWSRADESKRDGGKSESSVLLHF